MGPSWWLSKVFKNWVCGLQGSFFVARRQQRRQIIGETGSSSSYCHLSGPRRMLCVFIRTLVSSEVGPKAKGKLWCFSYVIGHQSLCKHLRSKCAIDGACCISRKLHGDIKVSCLP
ncbi:uncharacterized protein BO88DRAFT_103371 [Aspergillus vadensis CBS 113365]|uniref:Uncharacterized protein n=1 Tax=Aspergillus vadensis (strain CBS 113365 / IMI 142717 / IBT 24658) TaxID=1448311 RepID=A0A319D0R0_ASPVC|nr:hypothetical protein BO88DRAFT_103371 [Aspergillus vadensis CBS 113365]PYH73702.1 hypothetical protein BO88DRAFT_103371 [Aspergillus vadensis CBS 113365]